MSASIRLATEVAEPGEVLGEVVAGIVEEAGEVSPEGVLYAAETGRLMAQEVQLELVHPGVGISDDRM
jgi:hypothetical protein